MVNLLVAVIFFIIGYWSHKPAAPPAPEIKVIENCKPSTLQVFCPKHDDSALRTNLSLCINTIRAMAGKLQDTTGELTECQQQIQAEKVETEYWKHRYEDYQCD